MKSVFTALLSGIALFAVAGQCSSAGPATGSANGGTVVVHPRDNRKGLTNPDMGWVFYKYNCTPDLYGARTPDDEVFDYWPGMNTIYYRIGWGHIEPERGEFNWEMIDRSARHWIGAGKQLAFRITAFEKYPEATPGWLACGYDPDNPEFLRELDRFLSVFAERYDGKPYVAFVDIGSIGVFGEGWGKYDDSTRIKHIDLYRKHFTNTLLVVNDDMRREVCEYALKNGMTIRDDSVMWHKNLLSTKVPFDLFWPTRPTILETCQYERTKKGKIPWKGGWSVEHLLEVIEEYHPSWVSVHTWPDLFWKEERDCIAAANLRMGYRLQLVEASWPRAVDAGQKGVALNMEWRNVAAAPCYNGGHVAVTLKNGTGEIVAQEVGTGFNIRSLEPGPKETFGPVISNAVQLDIPESLPAGRYDVYVSVGDRDGNPIYALPYDNEDGSRRYPVGKIEVE